MDKGDRTPRVGHHPATTTLLLFGLPPEFSLFQMRLAPVGRSGRPNNGVLSWTSPERGREGTWHTDGPQYALGGDSHGLD